MEMVQQIFKISNDIQADEMLSEIRELQAEKNRFEMIFNARMAQLKQDYEREIKSIEGKIEFDKSMLQAYFSTVSSKETKIQKTYKLLSGKLVMRKPSLKISHNDAEILEWALINGKEYIKEQPKLDWSKLKEALEIKDNVIVNKETGEVLDIEGLKVEQVSEQFEIKL